MLARLGEVDKLMKRKRWAEAKLLLEELDRHYPKQPELLARLVNTCYSLQDMSAYQLACEHLLEADANNPEATLGLAGSYLATLCPILAIKTFRNFLHCWPDNERADEVRKTLVDLEAKLDNLLTEMQLVDVKDGFELAALHEQAQIYLERNEYKKARRAEETILQAQPTFLAALNNLSQICFADGDLEGAIANSQQVLNASPNNHHALSNLTRYFFLNGQIEAAQKTAEQLKTLSLDAIDLWSKKAEALTYLGDDQGVLDTLAQAETIDNIDSTPNAYLLYHLAAVAAMRQDDTDRARRYWKKALRLQPQFDLAVENLADLKRPVEHRHAPYPFHGGNWIAKKTIDQLALPPSSSSQPASNEETGEAIRCFLEKQPNIARLLPVMLERGDPPMREFAFTLASAAKTPALLEELKDFALSQHGPDSLRVKAANVVLTEGLLPSGHIRMWTQGQWREVLLIGMEIHDGPYDIHSPQVQVWLDEAIAILKLDQAKDAELDRAEQLLNQARTAEPNAPDIQNNLASLYSLQGRTEESDILTQETIQTYPDYVLARINQIRRYVRQGKLDEAEALMRPILACTQIHFDEFSALCNAQIELLVAQDKVAGARSWLEIWEQGYPQHPQLRYWKEQLKRPRALKRLLTQ